MFDHKHHSLGLEKAGLFVAADSSLSLWKDAFATAMVAQEHVTEQFLEHQCCD